VSNAAAMPECLAGTQRRGSRCARGDGRPEDTDVPADIPCLVSALEAAIAASAERAQAHAATIVQAHLASERERADALADRVTTLQAALNQAQRDAQTAQDRADAERRTEGSSPAGTRSDGAAAYDMAGAVRSSASARGSALRRAAIQSQSDADQRDTAPAAAQVRLKCTVEVHFLGGREESRSLCSTSQMRVRHVQLPGGMMQPRAELWSHCQAVANPDACAFTMFYRQPTVQQPPAPPEQPAQQPRKAR
jgi:hypothetical protein